MYWTRESCSECNKMIKNTSNCQLCLVTTVCKVSNSKFEWTKAEQESHIVQLSLLLLLITEYCHSVAFQIIKLTKVKTRPKTTVKLIDI